MMLFIFTLIISLSNSYFPTQSRTKVSAADDVPKKTVNIPVLTSVPKKIEEDKIPEIPFYSQFKDIKSPEWQKVGCGVTSLAMIIDYYNTNTVPVDTLLTQGIDSGAYLKNVGWTYSGLISLGRKYGLSGKSFDLAKLSEEKAFLEFERHLKTGPVIVSVHYKFDPQNQIPHLVVINGMQDDLIHYNDPAAKIGDMTISTTDFLKAWKKRFIVIRPEDKNSPEKFI